MKVFALFLLPFILFLASCQPSAAPVSISNKPVSINGIPDKSLPVKNIENLGWEAFDGNHQTLNDFKGRVVVLDFWATYCPPCLEEIPHLVTLQSQYGAENLQIVGLHVGGEEDRAKVPAFVEKLKINYVLAYPEDNLTQSLLGNDYNIPQTFVFDKNGKLTRKFVGFDEKIKTDLDQAIEQSLKPAQ